MSEQNSLAVFGMDVDSSAFNDDNLQALEILSTGNVPKGAVKSHPGKGGKVFSYVSHAWVTQQLRRAFGQHWSMAVQDAHILDDSAYAFVTLKLRFPTKSGGFLENEITEIGTFDGGGGKMSKANMLASAVSRGLVRCAYRRFGIGEEFYDADEVQMTASEAWQSLKAMGLKGGMEEEEIKTFLRENGITGENIADRWMEGWKLLYSRTHNENASSGGL